MRLAILRIIDRQVQATVQNLDVVALRHMEIDFGVGVDEANSQLVPFTKQPVRGESIELQHLLTGRHLDGTPLD